MLLECSWHLLGGLLGELQLEEYVIWFWYDLIIVDCYFRKVFSLHYHTGGRSDVFFKW